ncbi:MAG: hypothetical protein GC191_09250 [Azospirillum sp.]|nr:hypothetical protein [Azospirillum sp.]
MTEKIQIGPELDAAVARAVFGMSDEKIERLRKRGRLPKYSWNHQHSLRIVEHFWRRRARDNNDQQAERFCQWFQDNFEDSLQHNGLLSTMMITSMPFF